MKHSLLTALATTVLLGLGGCAWWGGGSDEAPSSQADTASQPPTPLSNHGDSNDAKRACGAHRLESLIGARLDQTVREQIVDQSQAEQFRVLAPDTIRTMDYHGHRLNIHVSGQGIIQSFDCG